MISAEEARKTTRSKIDVHLEYIESEIKSAINSGETSVLLDSAPYCNWCRLSESDEEKEVVDKLRDLGFSVKHYFFAGTLGNSFTGETAIGLKIDWSGEE